MAWDTHGGFTTGDPWLPVVAPEGRNVESQHEDAESLVNLYRRLVGLRQELGEGFRFLESEPGVVAYERGDHVVAVNTTAEPCSAPAGKPVLATHEGPGLPPHAALVVQN